MKNSQKQIFKCDQELLNQIGEAKVYIKRINESVAFIKKTGMNTFIFDPKDYFD